VVVGAEVVGTVEDASGKAGILAGWGPQTWIWSLEPPSGSPKPWPRGVRSWPRGVWPWPG